MIVAHNMQAINASRQLGINRWGESKSAEKLSSGYKVNRAADDAAGLSISEKMRKQIRGLTQASCNAEDGISMVQIADGAMEEIHEMLRRAYELSIKAANGTLSQTDRQDVQNEIDQICTEIDGVSEKTKFNEIYVLKSEVLLASRKNPNAGQKVTKGEIPAWVSVGGSVLTTGSLADVYQTTKADGTIQNHAAARLDFSGFNASTKNSLYGTGFHTTCCTCNRNYSIEFTKSNVNNITKTSHGDYVFEIGIEKANTSEQLLKAIQDAMYHNSSGYCMGDATFQHNTYVAVEGTNLVVYDYRDITTASPSPAAGRGVFGRGIVTEEPPLLYSVVTRDKQLNIQVGDETGNFMNMILPSISCETLSIKGLSVMAPGDYRSNPAMKSDADRAIESLSNAIQIVSADRSRMGAYQNRLEHTIRNLDNIVENTTSSESLIRDTDMAKEMVNYSNLDILTQAGQSILAQANQVKQGILTILG